MLKPISLNLDEKEFLLGWMRNGVSSLIRNRAHAILLSSQGKTASLISQILFRERGTVSQWIKSYHRRRFSSLFDKYKGNHNASKLTIVQRVEIKKVLAQPPSKYGLPREFWQVKDLKKWIKAEFGVVYESDRSYHFLFKLGRFSWKLPNKFDIKRDDRLVKSRVKEIREEIKPLLNSKDWVVLASDETRLVWENESRRAWLRTNKKTILRVNRSRDYQSFLGSLNLRTGRCHLHSLSWQNQEETIKALKKLKKQYPDKSICLVWDNAAWHKGKRLRKELKRGASLSNFHLINFPPYAPETNPVEHVWKYAKDRAAHIESSSFKRRVNNFKLSVIHRKFNYKI